MIKRKLFVAFASLSLVAMNTLPTETIFAKITSNSASSVGSPTTDEDKTTTDEQSASETDKNETIADTGRVTINLTLTNEISLNEASVDEQPANEVVTGGATSDRQSTNEVVENESIANEQPAAEVASSETTTDEQSASEIKKLTQKYKKIKKQLKKLKAKQKSIVKANKKNKKELKKTLKENKELKKRVKNLIKNRLEVPSEKKLGIACASYMPYKAITSKTSLQYKLQHWENTKTNKEGVRYVVDAKGVKRICVAMGTYYGPIGTKLKITLKNGKSFHAIVADHKSDSGTDKKHQYHKYKDGTKEPGDHSVIEFVTGDSATFKKYHQLKNHYTSNSFVKCIEYEGKEKQFL